MLKLSEFVWTLRFLVRVVFNNFLFIDTTDRSKIISDQKRLFFAISLYPLSFFKNTPFNEKFKFFLSELKYHPIERRILLCLDYRHLLIDGRKIKTKEKENKFIYVRAGGRGVVVRPLTLFCFLFCLSQL